MWQLYGAESRKVSLHVVWHHIEWAIWPDLQWRYTKSHSSHKEIWGVTIDNKLSFDEHIIHICKTANKKLNAVSTINHYMKQSQKEKLLPSFIISHFSCCPLIWMFCSKKYTKKINAVHERSFLIILNNYESPYLLLLEEAHQITFHRRCINSLMIKVYYKLSTLMDIHLALWMIFSC